MIGIYKIINRINGKFYIGKSNDIQRRWNEHCSLTRYKRSNIPLEWAIHKYGKENFSLEILQECLPEELDRLETYWIDKTNAIEEGYNCNRGGEIGTRGASNPNAKLSEDDVFFIRKCYSEHLITQKEAYNVVKDKIAFSTFQSIWQGKSWPEIMPEVYTEANKEYYKKLAGVKISGKLTEEQVMNVRELYAKGFTAKELYPQYQKEITYQAFQGILCGRTFKHLPYFHKKTGKWILPGEEPEKNKNRVKTNLGKTTSNKYSDEEVISFRKQYINQDYKTIYEKTDKRISQESFQKMLSGRTYTHLPVYSKTKQKWVYK